MANTTVLEQFLMEAWSRRSDKDPWIYTPGIYRPVNVPVRVREFPDAVYRKIPQNLFVSSTSRTTKTTILQLARLSQVSWDRLAMTKGRRMDDCFWFTNDFPSSDISLDAMYNSIRNEIRGKAVNLAMMMAEYRQTAELFLDAARFIASRGRTLPLALKARHGVANLHLGFQYGVRPLVSDLTGLAQQMISRSSVPLVMSGRKYRAEFRQKKRTTSDSGGFGQTADVNIAMNRRVRVKWQASLSPDGVRNTLVRSGFGNPVSVAWEVVPYSFVVDWWFNVGDVLQSLDNLLLINDLQVIKSDSVTTMEEVTAHGRNDGIGFSPGFSRKIVRTDIRNAPTSISRVNSLLYKPSPSLQHILNGMALLSQARGRR